METDAKLVVAIGLSRGAPREQLLRKYRNLLRLGSLGQRRQALWLAPTQAVARDVREELALLDDGALLDPGVTTFGGFAASIVRDGERPLRQLSTLQRRRLVRQVISQGVAAGTLKYFGPVAASSGLANLVDETLARLRRRDVSAEDYRRQNQRGTPRLRELAELYARYDQLLAERDLIDTEGLFRAARDRMRKSPLVGSGIKLAVVDGFAEFTAPQLEMLHLLVERAEQVVVTLLGETGERERRDLFARTMATRRLLVEELGATVEVADEDEVGRQEEKSAWPALDHLRANLFRSYRQLEPASPVAVASLDRIQVVAASSVRAEIEEIARRVKSLLVAGTRPGDIGVTFRSTFEVADRIRQTFDDFGIPFYLDASRKLQATPLVRSLLNVLRLEMEDWPYRLLLHVVGDRSVGWWDGGPGGGAGANRNGNSARSGVEWLVRQAQLPQGREELLAYVGDSARHAEVAATKSEAAKSADRPAEPHRPLFDELDDDPFGDVAEIAGRQSSTSRLVAELADRGFDAAVTVNRLHGFAALLAELPQRATIPRWIAAAEKLVTQLGLFAAGRDAERAPHARREWAILAEGLQSAAHVDEWAEVEQPRLSLAEFLDLAATTAAELPAPEKQDATGRVQVLSAEGMRYLRSRHLFVGGLSELAFPAARGVTSEGEADEADAEEILGDARSDEMLLFYEIVTAPTESLTLSFPALDAKAQALPPSPYLVELERCFGEGAIKRTVQPLSYEHQHGDVPLSRSDVRRHAVLRAHETRDRRPDAKLLAALLNSPRFVDAGHSIVEGIHAVARRGDRKIFGEFEGLVSSAAARATLLARYGPEYIWSPSRLETYAACPFRFFGEHLLKLEPLPELALESDLARRGSLLHDTLAKLYGLLNELTEQGTKLSPQDVAANFQVMLDRVVGERPRRGLDEALVEIERRQIAAWAEQFARQHEEYFAAWPHVDQPLKASYFEARFGPKNRRSESTDDATLSTDEPFQLKIGEEQIRFTGQIDRIDVGQVGGVTVFNVIDYKTSAKQRVDDAKMRAGTQLQLPLYAMAVAELLLAEQEAVGLSAGYWSIRGKGFGANARSGGPLALSEVEKGVLREAAHWPELKGALVARIGEIVDGIRQGWFPVFNEDKDCGQYCPLNTGCRIAHVRSLEKRWLPPKEVEA